MGAEGVLAPVEAEVRQLGAHVGERVALRGWVQTTRFHGKIGFVVLRDATGVVQCVAARNELAPDVWERLQSLTLEASVAVTGAVRADPRAPGSHELAIDDLVVIGTSDEYPIQPKEHGVDFLLDHRHLWLRSSQQRAALRVRSEVEQSIHDFFYDRDFVRIDTPILTGAIGEGGAGLFDVDY